MLKNADPCGDVLLDEALKHIKVRNVYLPDTGLEILYAFRVRYRTVSR